MNLDQLELSTKELLDSGFSASSCKIILTLIALHRKKDAIISKQGEALINSTSIVFCSACRHCEDCSNHLDKALQTRKEVKRLLGEMVL